MRKQDRTEKRELIRKPAERDRMAPSRALITSTERERLEPPTGDDREETDAEREKRYQAVSRVRRRVENELPTDIRILKENRLDVLAGLLAVSVREGFTDPDALEALEREHPAEYRLLVEAVEGD